jgi:hypothetical protein
LDIRAASTFAKNSAPEIPATVGFAEAFAAVAVAHKRLKPGIQRKKMQNCAKTYNAKNEKKSQNLEKELHRNIYLYNTI